MNTVPSSTFFSAPPEWGWLIALYFFFGGPGSAVPENPRLHYSSTASRYMLRTTLPLP